MPEINAALQQKVMRNEKIMSLQFRPEAKIDFLAGQFAQVVLDEANRNNKALNKYLSFSCRPGQEIFEVTKKLSDSDFSARLKALRPGDRVLFKGPLGNCTLPPQAQKVGFLVGGIGITPVISMVDEIVERQLPVDVCLLYSNWTAADIAYKQELDSWSLRDKNLKIVHTLVECRPQDKSCFSGMITPEFVQKQMPDYRERQLFIFGPPGMVGAMQDICQKLGCDKAKIKAENFTGY